MAREMEIHLFTYTRSGIEYEIENPDSTSEGEFNAQYFTEDNDDNPELRMSEQLQSYFRENPAFHVIVTMMDDPLSQNTPFILDNADDIKTTLQALQTIDKSQFTIDEDVWAIENLVGIFEFVDDNIAKNSRFDTAIIAYAP